MLRTLLSTRKATLLLLALVYFAGQPAFAQDPDAILDRIKTKYESVNAVQAQFTQTIASQFADESTSSTGQITFQDDSYRVEVGGQTIVTDGTTTWIYDPANNQVLINDYVQDASTFSVNDFFFNFDEQYNISSTGTGSFDGEAHVKLTLAPKAGDSLFERVILWMSESDDLVKRMEVTDVNGTEMVFQLNQIVLNPRISTDLFQLKRH